MGNNIKQQQFRPFDADLTEIVQEYRKIIQELREQNEKYRRCLAEAGCWIERGLSEKPLLKGGREKVKRAAG